MLYFSYRFLVVEKRATFGVGLGFRKNRGLEFIRFPLVIKPGCALTQVCIEKLVKH